MTTPSSGWDGMCIYSYRNRVKKILRESYPVGSAGRATASGPRLAECRSKLSSSIFSGSRYKKRVTAKPRPKTSAHTAPINTCKTGASIDITWSPIKSIMPKTAKTCAAISEKIHLADDIRSPRSCLACSDQASRMASTRFSSIHS